MVKLLSKFQGLTNSAVLFRTVGANLRLSTSRPALRMRKK